MIFVSLICSTPSAAVAGEVPGTAKIEKSKEPDVMPLAPETAVHSDDVTKNKPKRFFILGLLRIRPWMICRLRTFGRAVFLGSIHRVAKGNHIRNFVGVKRY